LLHPLPRPGGRGLPYSSMAAFHACSWNGDLHDARHSVRWWSASWRGSRAGRSWRLSPLVPARQALERGDYAALAEVLTTLASGPPGPATGPWGAGLCLALIRSTPCLGPGATMSRRPAVAAVCAVAGTLEISGGPAKTAADSRTAPACRPAKLVALTLPAIHRKGPRPWRGRFLKPGARSPAPPGRWPGAPFAAAHPTGTHPAPALAFASPLVAGFRRLLLPLQRLACGETENVCASVLRAGRQRPANPERESGRLLSLSQRQFSGAAAAAPAQKPRLWSFETAGGCRQPLGSAN